MRHSRKTLLPLAAALALFLVLATACGGRGTPDAPPPAASAPGEEAAPAQPAASQPETPTPAPEAQDPAAPQPEEPAPEESQPEASAAPAPEPDPEPAPAPEPEPEPDPEPDPDPELAPEEAAPEDGAYTAEVTLEGGTGRAAVESPAALRCENGQFWATIVWSSPNFDYMKVDGEKYELVSEPGGNSAFEIPVAAFDQTLDVIADTVAMSEPHEVEYTLTFDSASLQKQ